MWSRPVGRMPDRTRFSRSSSDGSLVERVIGGDGKGYQISAIRNQEAKRQGDSRTEFTEARAQRKKKQIEESRSERDRFFVALASCRRFYLQLGS